MSKEIFELNDNNVLNLLDKDISLKLELESLNKYNNLYIKVNDNYKFYFVYLCYDKQDFSNSIPITKHLQINYKLTEKTYKERVNNWLKEQIKLLKDLDLIVIGNKDISENLINVFIKEIKETFKDKYGISDLNYEKIEIMPVIDFSLRDLSLKCKFKLFSKERYDNTSINIKLEYSFINSKLDIELSYWLCNNSLSYFQRDSYDQMFFKESSIKKDLTKVKDRIIFFEDLLKIENKLRELKQYFVNMELIKDND